MTTDVIEDLSFEDLFSFEDDSSSKDNPPQDPVEPTKDPEPDPEETPPVDKPKQPEEDSDEDLSTLDFLKASGLLIVPDDFNFEDEEAKDKAVELTRQAYQKEAFEVIWNAVPPDFQSALQYALSGGESLKDYYENFNVDYENLPLETVEDQRKVIFTYYKTASKKTDEQINKIINRLEDTDLLEESAIEYAQELKDIQAEKLEALNNRAEAARKNAKLQAEETYRKMDVAITQLEDPTRVSKVKNFFFNEVQFSDNTKSTQFDAMIRNIKSTPEHLVQLGTILLDAYDPKKGFNLEKFIKQGETRANKSIKTLLEQKIDSKNKVKGAASESKPSEGVNLANFFDY